jgi:hypothetical protein
MKIIKIDKKTADLFVSKKHYSKRPSIFWAGFGLIENNMVVGVVVYGQPSPSVQKYAFQNRSFRFYELSRLVIQTKTKNAASFLIGQSLSRLEKPSAVISYADEAMSHCGIVYQATNWIYTGRVKGHDKTYIVDGVPTHPMSLTSKGITNLAQWAKSKNIATIDASFKNRYFFLNGTKRQKQKMLESLRYPVVHQYPKCNQKRYNDGELLHIPVVETKNNNTKNLILDF